MRFSNSTEYPIGDLESFIKRGRLSYNKQKIYFDKMLNFDEDLAKLFYDNGIIVSLIDAYKAIPYYNMFSSETKVTTCLRDIWYDRAIFHVDEPSNELKNTDKEYNKLRFFNNELITSDYFFDGSQNRYVFYEWDDHEEKLLSEIRHELCKIAKSKERNFKETIPVWYASNRKEVVKIITSIESTLKDQKMGDFSLWFRGQDKEYRKKRDSKIVKYLGYDCHEEGDISLLPSLAREFKDEETKENLRWASQLDHIWKKAVIVWVLINNLEWFPDKEKYKNLLTSSLESEDELLIGKLLVDIYMNPYIHVEADDFRQYFFVDFKYGVLKLILQHYGMPSSTLDITKNLDVALFFTQHKFDHDSCCYKNVLKNNTSVIYIFAENKKHSGTGVINIRSSEDIFAKDYLGNIQLPLRIRRQECGLLYSANKYGINFYSTLIIGKIVIKKYSDKMDSGYERHLFPLENEDDFYNILLRCRPKLERLVVYKDN